MNILISGDFFISDEFKNKDLIDQSVIDLFQKTDYRLVNLEAPLTANEPKNKILKTGPHLRMSEVTVMPYLKLLKLDAVKLANNHILDYGATGLQDTFESLKQNRIGYVGAGNNLNEATQPLTLEKDGMRIAILNFCENEWSIAEEDKPGANPLDIIDNVNQIKAAKATHDKVICIIHGGHEYYHLPSPRMQKQYRFYVDNGADTIVGHHTHCVGGYEIYNEVPIIYSLGNFIFTLPSKHEQWYFGLLAQLKIEKDKAVLFELLPVEQKTINYRVSLLETPAKNKIMHSLNEYNDSIDNEIMLHKSWNLFLEKYSTQYLNTCSPTTAIGNRFIRGGLNRLGISRYLQSNNYKKTMLNLFRCEAHLDATKSILKNKLIK